MTTRSLISTCVIGLMMLSAAAVLADGAQGPGPRGGGQGPGNRGGMDRRQPPALPDSTEIVQMVNELAESLALSVDQKTQISDLYLAHFAEMRSEMNGAPGDREDHRKKMDILRQEFEDDVKAVLTEEQQAGFDKLAKKRRPPQRR